MNDELYYIADAKNGVLEGPLTISEANIRLTFWINDKIEREFGENGLSYEETEENATRFYSIITKERKYSEVAIQKEEWLRINARPSDWYMNLWAWLLGKDFNPLAEIEICDYNLSPLREVKSGEMYFEDIETGSIYSGKLVESVTSDGSRIYMFTKYKDHNEIQSPEIR